MKNFIISLENYKHAFSLNILLNSLFTPLLIVLFLWISECIFLGNPRPSKNKIQIKELILWFIHYSPISNALALISSFGVFNIIKWLLNDYRIYELNDLNPTVKALFYLIIIDFLGYLVHYLFHKIRMLWNFHQFHHSAKSFDIITVHRVHFFEISFLKISHTLPLVLLGGEFKLFSLYYIFSVFLGHVKHSQFKFNWPSFIKYVIQSPAHHWIHHSNKPEHFNKNFGEVLQLWDTIFNTGYNPNINEIKNIELGTNETTLIYDNFYKLFTYPYLFFFNKK